MDQWKAMGRFVSRHMPLIIPGCVVAGVCLPQVFHPLTGAVPFLFAFMTFQGALNNTLGQLAQEFRHPQKLLIILGISLVFMPALAHALAMVFYASDMNLVTGIVLEYSVPIGVVCFMWVGIFEGNGPLALAAILVSTVIAPFTIPATLQVLLGKTVHIDAMNMMVNMIFMIALPALAGMLVNDATHGWGHERLSPAIDPVCRLLLVLIITVNSSSMSSYVLHMTWLRASVAGFILVFAASGFVWGIVASRVLHLERRDMVTICFGTGLRNISSGAVIATQYFPGEVVFPVIAGTMFQQILTSLFGRVIERIAGKTGD